MISLSTFKKLIKFQLISLILLPPNIFALSLPTEYAQVQEEARGSNGKTLFLIQEVHVNYEAQKSIIEILKSLVQTESLRLILVEGGWDDMGLSYLRSYGSEEGRRQVAETYLQKGFLSAEEYLDITSDDSLKIWGIEDPELYQANIAAFLKLREQEQAIDAALFHLIEQITHLQEKSFGPQLLELGRKRKNFSGQTSSPLGYIEFLLKFQPEVEDLNDFPQLKALLSYSNNEDGFQAEKMELEKQRLIQALSRKLTKFEFARLNVTRPIKAPEEELGFITRLISAYEKDPTLARSLTIENLKHHRDALSKMTAVDSGRFFDEIQALEETVIQKLLKTDDERAVWSLSRQFELIENLLALKLGPSDFEKVLNLPQHFLQEWQRLIGDLNTSLLQRSIEEARGFYQAAQAREKAMIEKAENVISAEGDSAIALIVGGFHYDPLASAFEKMGYTVVKITPRFSVKDLDLQHQQYFDVLKYKSKNLFGASSSAIS